MQNQQKYSDSTKQTSETLQGTTSFQTSRNLSGKPSEDVKVYRYDDIPLKLFLDIAETNEFEKLVIEGEATLEYLIECWEAIIQRNSEENSSFQYQSYFSLYQGYSLLVAQEFNCKVMFMILSLKKDPVIIEELRKKGYKIDDTDDDSYSDSLAKAVSKSGALVTKIKSKKNELEKFSAVHHGAKRDGYEDLIADLEFALGWTVGDNITLAKYNRLKKRAKQKADAITEKMKRKK